MLKTLMKWVLPCILILIAGCVAVIVAVAVSASKHTAACLGRNCSTTQLLPGYGTLNCDHFQTANRSFICDPSIQCDSVEECRMEETCASTDDICVINSCCPKSVCVSLAFAQHFCPTSSPKTTTIQAITEAASEQCADTEAHVIGVYEAASRHFFGYHPTSDATVRLERTGDQVLVLSSYEPIRWRIELAANVRLRAVHLIGYYNQTLASSHPGTSVTADIQTGVSCGYSWPYNGQGCDTNRIINLARQYAGGEIKSFHGCYHASRWTIDANFHATSNCPISSGYQQYSWYPACTASESQWRSYNFKILGSSSCSLSRYIRYNAKYRLWIGAILCNSGSRYKLYLSDASNGTFLDIADYAGHGQDHCELVNPSFSILNEDDITSGGCTQCAIGGVIDVQNVDAYARGYFGESFERRLSSFWGDLTTGWYQCGVNIP